MGSDTLNNQSPQVCLDLLSTLYITLLYPVGLLRREIDGGVTKG